MNGWLGSLEGTIVAGRYRLEKLIGTGGMGAVFEGVHNVTGRHVAIKVLVPEYREHPKAIKRFEQEARAAATTNRKGVVEVLDFDVDPEVGHFLVMELLEGESLQQRIKRLRRLEPDEALTLALELLETLEVVHSKSIVHRDLKPANIFLAHTEEDGEIVKVLDFGISRVATANRQTQLTVPGMAVGTPRYMAPEQAEGAPGVDGRADVYSVGAVLYEALSGIKPYQDAAPGNVLSEVLLHPTRPLHEVASGLPQILHEVVDRAMQRNRKARYQTAREMIVALTDAREQLSLDKHQSPTSDAPEKPGSPSRTRDGRSQARGVGQTQRSRRRFLIPIVVILGVLSSVGGLVIGLVVLGVWGGDGGPEDTHQGTATPQTSDTSALAPGVANPSVAELSLRSLLDSARREAASGDSDRADQLLHKLIGQGELTGVRPETGEARIMSEAHLMLSELIMAKVSLPQAPVGDDEFSNVMEKLTRPHGEAMEHAAKALALSKQLNSCVAVFNGEATERVAALQIEMLESDPHKANLTLDTVEFLRTSASTHLVKARQYYQSSLEAPDVAGCKQRATVGIQRVNGRLSTVER